MGEIEKDSLSQLVSEFILSADDPNFNVEINNEDLTHIPLSPQLLKLRTCFICKIMISMLKMKSVFVEKY